MRNIEDLKKFENKRVILKMIHISKIHFLDFASLAKYDLPEVIRWRPRAIHLRNYCRI